MVRFLPRWACLFRRELLQHCAVCGIRSVLSVGATGPLGGAFTREVPVFTGSSRWRLDIYKYCRVSRLLLLPPSAIVHALALPAIITRVRTLEHIAAERPFFFRQDAGEARRCQ